MQSTVSEGFFPVVGIGASAGGLEALRELLSGFEDGPDMAFVVVQHLDPNHESMMAQLIERYTTMPVRQIEGGEQLENNHVYVIPPGSGLEVRDGMLSLVKFVEPRGLRRPIDDFFESLAADCGAGGACVILSGTGADGSRGLRAIKEHGGLAVVQDPEDARYDGMPLSAVGTGLVDYIASARDIIPTLRAYFERQGHDRADRDDTALLSEDVDQLCAIMRDVVGHDFSGYKRSTLTRRVRRRMQVLGIEQPQQFVERLRRDGEECRALLRDLLINVTRFFRDPEAFEALRDQVIAPLIAGTGDDEEIRVWVPGCSSGEEAYSIAMLCRSEMDRQGRRPIVSIFASDIDEQMLQIAREGRYPVAALADVPEAMHQLYTVGHGETFTLAPAIRDMVRFSVHSVIKDPPFSKIDLISCRNLLIYFDDRLQQAVLPLFHYALSTEGSLFLGSSESVGRFDDLFDAVDNRARIFRRRSVRPSYPLELPATARRPVRRPPAQRASRSSQDWIESDAQRQMIQNHAPASVLVDGQGTLLANWGPVGRYFDFPADHDRRIYLPTLAKAGLRPVLGGLIRETAADGRRHLARGIDVLADFGTQQVDVICEPVRDGTFLIVIREIGAFSPASGGDVVELAPSDRQVELLEEELRITRHRLRSAVEELETANEELKSSNEEMMSMNEELQSTNEELTTVNDELNSKLDQLTVANSDLRNFFDSTQLAVIVVDRDLAIRSFTPAARSVLPLKDGDQGRSLADIAGSVSSGSFPAMAAEVIRTGQPIDDRVRTERLDRDYVLSVMPYRRVDGSIDGATLVFTDVTRSLVLERDLATERERLELAIRVAGIGVWEYDPNTGITVLDEKERELLGASPDVAEVDIESILLRIHDEDRPRVNEGLRKAMDGQYTFDEVFRIGMPDGSLRWIHGLGRRIRRGKEELHFVGVSYDISAEREALSQRDLLLREMNHRIKNLFTVVGAMISTSRRSAEGVADFASDLSARIEAMNRAHMLTQQLGAETPVPLDDLIETVLMPARGTQAVTLSGPRVDVPVKRLTPLALILHEWATNAAKYGALSFAEGRLDIAWTVDGNRMRLEWRERIPDGDRENQPGFGTRLVEASVRQLKGKLDGGLTDGQLRRVLSLDVLDDLEG